MSAKKIEVDEGRFAAIIRKYGKPVEAGDGYVLSVPLKECVGVSGLKVIPADGADGLSISYIAYEEEYGS